LVSVILLGAALNAAAQAWPSRPIRLIVPFVPGGLNDVMGRLAANGLTARLGVPVIVENVGGASTIVGQQRVVSSAPDGYTILIIGPDFTTQPLLRQDLPFDPAKDLVPVAMLGFTDYVYAVNAKSSIATFPELIKMAKARPGAVKYSTSGIGTLQHFSGEMLSQQAGIEMIHVPYKGGAPAATAVISNDVDMVITALVSIKSHVDSGRMRIIVSDGPKRSPRMPNVPTMRENGFPDLSLGAWVGIFAPAGIPKEVLQRLRTELEAVVLTPEFRSKTEALDFSPPLTSGEGFRAFLDNHSNKLRKVFQENRAKFTD
jgi:tripartite-type tricarboxylate transporter receptor subunit TctC